MRKNNCLYAILSIMMIVSCDNTKQIPCDADYSDVDTISYNYKEGKAISRDSVFGKISFLPLETRKDNLIGMTDKVILGDSTIIIVDKYIAKSVFMFDYSGVFIGRISNQGNGRNEYLEISDVCQRPDKSIAIFDELKGIILVYDERGNYIETIKSELFGSAMEFIDEELMAFDIYNRYPAKMAPYGGTSFVIKDKEMNNKYLFGTNNKLDNCNYSRFYNLYSFGGNVYCNVNFEDYIFQFCFDSVKAKYRIEYGPENVNRYPYKTKEELYSLQKQYPFFEGEFVELKDYTYLMFRGEDGNELIYNHSTKETIALSFGFNNPMIVFFRRPMARYKDNTLVCALTASELLAHRSMLSEATIQKETVDSLFSVIDIDSNPVLFFFEVVL